MINAVSVGGVHGSRVGDTKPPSSELGKYRGYSKLRTRTALGSYTRPMPRNIGSPQGRCVSLISSDPCIRQSRIDSGLGLRNLGQKSFNPFMFLPFCSVAFVLLCVEKLTRAPRS